MTDKGVIYNLDWSKGRVFAPDLLKCVYVDEDGFITEKYRIYEQALADNDYDTLGLCMNDDTIYAYAALKWDGKPIRMKYYQDAIVSDDHRRIDVEAANQQGKSFSLCVKASVKFMQNHGRSTHIGLISKSQAQNSMNMRMVRKMLKEANFVYTPGSNDNMTVMVHDLGDGVTNTLVCSVASTSALGYPFDWLLLDEFEFWENPEGLEYMYDQVLEPRTFKTRGQIVIYSNPNGKNFVSENLHKRMINVDGREEYQFRVYNVNFLDNQENSREEWDMKMRHVHPIIFASTMAAQRTESEGSALSERDIMSTRDDELTASGMHLAYDKKTFWALDLGFSHDQSVLIAGWKENINDEIVFRFAVKAYQQNYPIPSLWDKEDMESVPSIINRFGNQMQQFELDLTGKEGNEVLAATAGLGCNGIKMSGQWKATHYERFISLVKQGKIRVSWEDNYLGSDNKNFVHQARTLRISTKMPNGNTRPYPLYHHTKETDHDDICDAVVLCLSLMDDDMGPTAGGFFIPGVKPGDNTQDKKTQEEQLKQMEEDDSIAGFDNDDIEMVAHKKFQDFQMYGFLP